MLIVIIMMIMMMMMMMMMASDLGLQALTKFQSLAMISVDDSVDWNDDVDVDDGSRSWSAGFSPEP